MDCLEIHDDVLYMTKVANTTQDRVLRTVIPEKLKSAVFHWSHCHLSSGHFGTIATTLRAAKTFYYPGMVGDLRRKTRICPTCLVKRQKVKLFEGTHVPRNPGFPGECISVDLVGPLPISVKGEKYILTIQDEFTRFVKAYPLKNKEAMTVARVLVDNYLSTFGMPHTIHSDNGKEFSNHVWNNICDRLMIRKTFTPPYNPHSNMVERFHRSLNQLFRVFLEREDTNWPRYLGAATLAYNTNYVRQLE